MLLSDIVKIPLEYGLIQVIDDSRVLYQGYRPNEATIASNYLAMKVVKFAVGSSTGEPTLKVFVERRSRIEELEEMIKYEKERMAVCATGRSDIAYLEELENELEELLENE